ncbi:MAG: SRPBCC family protein, partial [Acidimicrobiia bacterium]
MRIEESIVISRPPEKVFAFFDNRRNDNRWMDTVVSSEWIDRDGPTALGRRGRMVMYAPRLTEFEDEVTEYEPGSRVGHRSVSTSMIVFTACYADPVPGGTRATVVFEPERLPGGVFGKLAAPLVARTVRRNYRADLARLKQILEDEADE